jgi:hypothetical protein
VKRTTARATHPVLKRIEVVIMKQNDRSSPAVILTILAAVLIIVVIVDYALHQNAGPDTRESMQLELFKSGLQLAIIVIVGGGIALLYKWVEHSWDATREQSELRKHYVARLGDAYRAVKEARRLLRAGGIRNVPGSAPALLTAGQIAHYDQQMAVISREQLKLEALMIESRNFPPVAESRLLTQEIRRMESYLGKIIDEYEDIRPRESIDLRQMKRVTEFTGEPDPQADRRFGTFQQNFVHPHYRAIRLVAEQQAPRSSRDQKPGSSQTEPPRREGRPEEARVSTPRTGAPPGKETRNTSQ